MICVRQMFRTLRPRWRAEPHLHERQTKMDSGVHYTTAGQKNRPLIDVSPALVFALFEPHSQIDQWDGAP